MTRGPAGYGRYNDSPEHVGCPFAKSDMTPCVARDGAICLSPSQDAPNAVCVGCGHAPSYLLADLAEEYEPARRQSVGEPAVIAARFAELVRAATAVPVTR